VNKLDQFELQMGSTSELGMVLVLGLMMFAVALGLRAEHFGFFRTAPRTYFSGVAAQLVGLPLLTLALCFLLEPLPSIALGMILIASCPGGNVSNLLVLLARGNTALSVSLTATSSIAAAFITPIAIIFWSSWYPPTANLLTEINFNTREFLTQTMLILALPLILGMLTVRFLPRAAQRLQKPLVAFGALGLLLIIFTTLFRYRHQFIELGPMIIGIVALHNASAFLLGLVTAKLSGADRASLRALTYEVGIQNSGLGIVILLTQLGGLGGAAAVAGLWGVWHIGAGLILVGVFRYFDG
jgi:BASS family bile acid:Na+ symporter